MVELSKSDGVTKLDDPKNEQVSLFGSEIVRLLLDEHVLSPTLHARTFSEAIVDQPHLFSGKSV